MHIKSFTVLDILSLLTKLQSSPFRLDNMFVEI